MDILWEFKEFDLVFEDFCLLGVCYPIFVEIRR